MRRINISEIQVKEDYRAIIPLTDDDTQDENIYIKNPTLEEQILYGEQIQKYLSGEDIEKKDIFIDMISGLTNIEVDEDIDFDSCSNILSQVLYHIECIFSELVLNIYMNLTLLYKEEIKKIYEERFLEEYNKYNILKKDNSENNER